MSSPELRRLRNRLVNIYGNALSAPPADGVDLVDHARQRGAVLDPMIVILCEAAQEELGDSRVFDQVMYHCHDRPSLGFQLLGKRMEDSRRWITQASDYDGPRERRDRACRILRERGLS